MMRGLPDIYRTGVHACALLGVLLPLAAAAVAPRLEVQARIHQDNGEVVQRSVAPGTVLRTGDEVRLRATAWVDGYLYVVALGSSGSATVLHPFSGPAEPVRAGEALAVPRDGGFLPLDSRTGRENLFAFVSDKPLESLTRLLVRLEAAGATADAASLREALSSEGFEAAHLAFNLAPAPVSDAQVPAAAPVGRAIVAARETAVPAPPPAGGAEQSEVLSALGSRIAQFTRQAPAGIDAREDAPSPQAEVSAPIQDQAQTRAPRAQARSSGGILASLFGFGGSTEPAEPAPQPPPVASTFPLTTPRNPLGSSAAARDGTALAPREVVTSAQPLPARSDDGPRRNTGPEPTLSRRVDESGRSALVSGAAAAGAEPPVQAALLTAAPARAVVQAAQLAQVDLRSNSGTAGAVVMVVTPEGATTGVLVDGRGHVLTNWHSVRNYDAVLVLFKQAGGTGPAVATRSRARLVGHSKFSDLALLQVDELPAGIAPAVLLASRVEVDGGEPLHAIGPGADGQWRQVVATVDRIRRNSSWYSTRRVLHRADVIRAEMADPQDVAGTPLFNNALELVGLGAMVRTDKGELIGVSAGTVRAFLAAAGG